METRELEEMEKKINEIVDAIIQIKLANEIYEKIIQSKTYRLFEQIVNTAPSEAPELFPVLEFTLYESLLSAKIYRITKENDKYSILLTTRKHDHRIEIRIENDDINVKWVIDDNKEMKTNIISKILIINELMSELRRYVIYLLQKQI